MKAPRRFPRQWIPPIIMIALIALSACSKQTAQQAGRGAAGGAVIGAVGGLVTGLVFGGNAAEAAARGAVYGASTGAAAGAMTGAMAERSQTPQQLPQNGNDLEKMRATLGEDAYSGLEALVDCKHEVALAYGRTAQQSANPDHALAGLWLQVITYADNRQEDKARAIFPELVTKDQKLSSEAQAETKMREALQKLMDIREEHRRPRVCG